MKANIKHMEIHRKSIAINRKPMNINRNQYKSINNV